MREDKVRLLNRGALRRGEQMMIRNIALIGLLACVTLVSHDLWSLTVHSAQTAHSGLRRDVQDGPYLYYVLKRPEGFVLARAHAGASRQPLESPHVVASFGDGFGRITADAIVSLQVSPDGRYMAIDGTHTDEESVWVFDTHRLTLALQPASASGTFLHWLPGAGEIFLFRPMFPRGPDAPLTGGIWQPGLWEVNAVTGAISNIDIHAPAALLVDAVPSPDGAQMIYSTCAGSGLGSDIWHMDVRSGRQTHILQLSAEGHNIAGLFAWAPGGQTVAYERLADSPEPFLSADLWVMNPQGGAQRFLARADGGHGFAVSWSPDGQKIAFVTRANSAEHAADQSTQALESAIDVVDVHSGQVWTVAGQAQTGVQINADPTWSPVGAQITFAAFNPLNPALGGTVRYWTATATPTPVLPAATPLSPAITHVIAFV
jgi:WD40 repeat protein